MRDGNGEWRGINRLYMVDGMAGLVIGGRPDANVCVTSDLPQNCRIILSADGAMDPRIGAGPVFDDYVGGLRNGSGVRQSLIAASSLSRGARRILDSVCVFSLSYSH